MPNDGHRLSLVLIVKNEARCLARCLQSVRSIADEIVVVDTGSTDDTVRIAREFGARIDSFEWVDDFAAARNFALEKAAGDWILVLDADEFASESLAIAVAAFIKGEPAIGLLRIISDFKRHDQTLRSQATVARLFPRGARFAGRIHEQIVSSLPRHLLKGELLHDGYLETNKSDRNIKLLLRELKQFPNNTHYLFQLAIEYTNLSRASDAFDCLQKAFSQLRFDESYAPNVVVDYLHAAMDLKEFDLGLKTIQTTRNRFPDFPDFHFVCGLFYMNMVRSNPSKHSAFLGEIEQCFQRCLAIGDTSNYKSVIGAGSFLAEYNLGVFYYVFDQQAQARQCFERAARQGCEPARRMLKQSNSQ